MIVERLKSITRMCFYRSFLARLGVGLASLITGRTKPIRIDHLLSYRGENAIGPLQVDEALALFGIVRSLCPKTVVEFGFFHGHSAFNFLQALGPDARLVSFDIDEESAQRAFTEFKFDGRFTFLHKSQTEFSPADLDGDQADLVFFDAAHELELNQITFGKIKACLAPSALIIVHDTGLWHKNHFQPIHHEFVQTMSGRWLDESRYAHQPGERRFIDWIQENHPGFQAIHFHSLRTLRHGFTILQCHPRLEPAPEPS